VHLNDLPKLLANRLIQPFPSPHPIQFKSKFKFKNFSKNPYKKYPQIFKFLDGQIYDILHLHTKQLTFLLDSSQNHLYQLDERNQMTILADAYTSAFPSKSLKTDASENNLYAQNSQNTILVFTNIKKTGFTLKLEITLKSPRL
jgi:hypothetical protein